MICDQTENKNNEPARHHDGAIGTSQYGRQQSCRICKHKNKLTTLPRIHQQHRLCTCRWLPWKQPASYWEIENNTSDHMITWSCAGVCEDNNNYIDGGPCHSDTQWLDALSWLIIPHALEISQRIPKCTEIIPGWTGSVRWTDGMDWWDCLVQWTGGMDCYDRLLRWSVNVLGLWGNQ